MAIDARIAAVTVVAPTKCNTCNMTGLDPQDAWMTCPACYGATVKDPQVRLKLEPREEGGCAGQDVLIISSPPTTDPKLLAGLVGTEIWGDATSILVGDRLWARRLSYTIIELVDPSTESRPWKA